MHTLMIVDDSNITRRKIERTQQSSLFNVVASVGNGVDAVNAFTQFNPSVITMDLTMPEMDGIEAIEKIRTLSDSVRILVISALNDKATAIKALQKGAQGFVCKPFTDYELQDALLEIIEE